MQDNELIKTGYRLGFKGHRAVMSTMCMCHNQTVNIWTHFIGALTFLTMCIVVVAFYQSTAAIGRESSSMLS